ARRDAEASRILEQSAKLARKTPEAFLAERLKVCENLERETTLGSTSPPKAEISAARPATNDLETFQPWPGSLVPASARVATRTRIENGVQRLEYQHGGGICIKAGIDSTSAFTTLVHEL